MSKLVTKGNLAVFEYEVAPDNPTFTFESNGVLWIEGYMMYLVGKPIRAMKRFDLKLKGYVMVGKYDTAKKYIEGDFSELVQNLNTERCVVFVKQPNAS